MPGGSFLMTGRKSNAFRIAFSYASEEQMECAMEKLAKALDVIYSRQQNRLVAGKNGHSTTSENGREENVETLERIVERLLHTKA